MPDPDPVSVPPPTPGAKYLTSFREPPAQGSLIGGILAEWEELRSRPAPDAAPAPDHYVVVIAPDSAPVELREFDDFDLLAACLREQQGRDADVVVVCGRLCPCLADPLRIETPRGVITVGEPPAAEIPRPVGRLGRPRDQDAAPPPATEETEDDGYEAEDDA